MAEEIVDLLEGVDVENGQRDRVVPPLGPCELGRESFGEGPTVHQSCERVAQGLALEHVDSYLAQAELLGEFPIFRRKGSVAVGGWRKWNGGRLNHGLRSSSALERRVSRGTSNRPCRLDSSDRA